MNVTRITVDHVRMAADKPFDQVVKAFEQQLGQFDPEVYQSLAAGETRRYDIERLNAVDMIMSYWSRRSIAHMLVSFGFDDGERVAFSVEVRREGHEGYSEIGGFFKDFELSIIAADERDMVRLRTNVRGEDVYLYRVRMPVTAMRSLFLAYVEEANTLVAEPRFYQTITGNCTTLVYRFMKRICAGRLPIDYRVLLSGYMPEFVYRVGDGTTNLIAPAVGHQSPVVGQQTGDGQLVEAREHQTMRQVSGAAIEDEDRWFGNEVGVGHRTMFLCDWGTRVTPGR